MEHGRVGAGLPRTAAGSWLTLEFRSRWAHEALTRENMSSWAHARTPTSKHSCSSEQIKQGHVPTSCGTPVRVIGRLPLAQGRRCLRHPPGFLNPTGATPPSDMNPHRDANDSRIGLAVPSVIPPMPGGSATLLPDTRGSRLGPWSGSTPLSSIVSILSQDLQRRRQSP